VKRTARLACLAGYVVATFLSFPHPVAGRVVDLGLAISWLGPALLLLGLEGLGPRRAARYAFAASLVAHSAVLHWIYVVTVDYGRAPALLGVLAPVGLAAYIAAFGAAFAAGWAGLERWGVGSALAAALLWTALEHLRSLALSGFPWATLGYAQHANEPLLALTAVTGVYGLSFLVVLGGGALACSLHRLRQGRGPGIANAAAIAAILLAHLPGGLAPPEPAEPNRIRIAVLQGNIEQGVKWSPEWAERTLAIYEELARRAAGQGARVIVWPETALPGSPDADTDLRVRVAELARETGASQVIGAVGLAFEPGATRPSHYFDSAYLLEADGTQVDRYDKSHLVPFGEYVPLRDLLGRKFKAVARGMASSDVTPGSGPRAISLAAPGSQTTRITVGVPICYELLFPDLVRRFVGDGAELLLAITNDAWYGRTGAPYQFLAMTAVRAAETRVWTARAANTGVSAIIDARGRVRAQTRIFERDLLVADVPLRPSPIGGSFYVRHGDVFAGGCWLGAVVVGVAGRTRSRRRPGGVTARPTAGIPAKEEG
jgi:apolipoprotein N-acyltransferase